MKNNPPSTNQIDQPNRTGFKRVLSILGVIVLCLLTLVLLLGLIPQPARDLDSEPDPANTYAEAMTRFQHIQEAELGIVNDASGSYLLVHDDRTASVYVLVHGTTNSPLQWLELGQILHEQGHNVLMLRMPYHGLQSHQVSELKVLTPQDLRDYADEAIDIAAGLGDEVIVVGISGGGVVAAWMIQNRPEVKRALLLAPFFGIHNVPDFAGTLLMNAFSRLPNVVLDDPLEPQRAWVYRGEATRGVASFLALGRDVMREAQDGVGPARQIIVVTTASDNTANNRSTAGLVDRWRRAGTDVVTFEFAPALNIPHNSIDPAADETKKRMVYDRMLELLGERP